MAEMRFTILGSGSSGGVPRIGGHWGDCDPKNPKNRRGRCSMLVERIDADGTTSVLIDTPPDMRNQLLDAEVERLDAVVFTHSHADHLHGIDDLRMVYYNMRQRIDVYADGPTQNDLLNRFGYAFTQPEGSPYPPILDLKAISGPFTIEGPGGAIPFRPFEVKHGSVDAQGFRIGGLAYLPDVKEIPGAALPELEGLEVWVLDALRRTPHPTHFSFSDAMEWFEKMAPKRGILTNMHIDMDYATLEAETPDHITPAYDGMVIRMEI
ncbi:MBL fold metallo-hydrolase [Leisingera sp. ANG-DT]|uniref:MBL fold metallo-hydrolase n=1 Tax=Leisingera sp. ANG-DT TaxID=1577897 RepID=UPI00057D712D|nr:MBL fold metallo-hydrolase [Leisingera sp. ANG-DT]KIC14695.1 PhnP [Leisingera sp. ANG-DT]